MFEKARILIIVVAVFFSFVCGAQTIKDLPQIKGSSVSMPVDEFSNLIKDAKISMPWIDFAKFLTSQTGVKNISIPWEMFLKYLELTAPAKPPVKPPVDYIITGVRYQGKPEENFCELKFHANLVVMKNPADGWTAVKLWHALYPAIVSEIKCDGKPVNLYTGPNGYYQFLVNQQGTFSLEGKLLAKLSGRGESLSLASIPNTACILNLSLPKDYQVFSSGAGMVKIDRTKESTEVQIAFQPGTSMDVSWSLMTKEPAEPRIFANANISSYIQPEIMRTNASIRYEILYQPVKSLKILLPDGVRLDNVSGNFLNWKQTDSTVQIELKPETKGSLNVDISYQQDLKPDTAEINIKSPLVPDAERVTGYFSVGSTQNIEVSSTEYENISLIDPKEMPGSTATTALAFKLHRLPFSAAVRITKYQELPVLEATCDSVNAITAATIDGKTITRMIYHVRNNARQFLTVKLPEKSQMWSVYVANNPIKPLAGKSGSILVPLPKAQGKSESAVPVEVIYYQPGIPFGKTGEFQINLPVVDIPVMHLMYSLYIPEKLTLDSFSGNLEKVERFSLMEDEDKKAFEKAPSEEKTKRETSRISKSTLYIASQQGLERNVDAALSERISGSISGTVGKAGEDSISGFLPLKIYIPTTGKLVRFEKRLIMDENIFVKARYKLALR